MSQQKLAKIRRVSQVLFFFLFMLHLVETEFRGSLKAVSGDIRLAIPYPAIFLQSDPLVALFNVLASRSLYRGLLWSLTILLPTFLLGRFFCGWICPLGTLNHFFGNLKSERKRGVQRIEANRYKKWHTLKYYILVAGLVSALLGGSVLAAMDPISLTVRSLAVSLLPAFNYACNAFFEFLGQARGFRMLADVLEFILKSTILSFRQPHFRQGFFLGLLFVVILGFNLRITRFWCRALCPLGALLGVLSRWSILGLEKRPGRCEDCNRCLLHCQGGDDPIPGASWRKAECHLCFNCVADCPESGIAFKFFPGLPAQAGTPTTVEGPDLTRRRTLAGVAAGAALLPVLRSATGLATEANPRLIRPPGSLDEKNFLSRCVRCGECMKVCPNNALHPTLSEAGLEGLWTPVLVPRVGYCEPSCVLCGQVCPTGAIWEITAAEKGWLPASSDKNSKPVRLGTAFYDRGRCLPWAMATECIVCEEWCPTSPKAIILRPAEVVDPAQPDKPKIVRQPYLDPDRCTGCGACEFACPVKGQPAVYVTSLGESRSKTSQILLRTSTPRATNFFPGTNEVPGWSKTDETRTFEASRLWEYIDGDADRYVQAGVEKTLTTDYRYRDRVEATADVYVMKASEGARKIFDSESSVGSKPILIGEAGRLSRASLVFRKGPYFVRLVAYEEAPELPDALVALGRAIEKKLEARG
jgi:polyferredoxin